MKIIAYYLPQYYPFPENDKWWGKGFTEWTNVAKAKPLFRGHEQPKVPKDLGFYDLRVPQVRLEQAKMAQSAGIYGFCYWHYWFGDGYQLLDYPIQEVIRLRQPDFPFCLGWANESWYNKMWNKDGSLLGSHMLVEQKYPGEQDIINHFNSIFPIVSDKRYIRIENKPVFLIYRPKQIPDFSLLKETFNKLLKETGIADSFYFIAHSIDESDNELFLAQGYDAINMMRLNSYRWDKDCVRANFWPIIKYKLFGTPLRLNYKKMLKYLSKDADSQECIFPSILPNWDHTPRSGKRGCVFEGSTPSLFKQHVVDVFNKIKNKEEEHKVVFLKSWNEWGEGNYMEPDLRWGNAYCVALREAIDEFENNDEM